MEALLKANNAMIEATAKLQKKQKIQHGAGSQGSPYFETIATKLHEIQKDLRKNYSDAQLDVIEVEVGLRYDTIRMYSFSNWTNSYPVMQVRIGIIVDNYRRWKSRSSSKSVAVVDPRLHSTLRFRAGVDHIFARKLKSKLNVPVFQCNIQPLQIPGIMRRTTGGQWIVKEHF